MTEHTPTDEQMQADWHAYITTPDEENYYYDALSSEEADARWSRWLAAHDARVRRDAEAELESWMTRAYEAEKRAWKAEKRLAGWMEHWNATARTGAVDEVAAVLEANARADQAEARIKAVEDVLNTVEDGHSTDPVIRGLLPRMVGTALIRRALDGA